MDIRKFRRGIARLKKAGLVKPDIDARSVKPTRALNKALQNYADVISGAAKAIPLSKLETKANELIERNYQVASPRGLPKRVIVRHFPDEKVVAKRGVIEFQSNEGFRRLELPHYDSKKSLKRYFADILHKKFPDLPRGAKVGARFFNGRTQTYSNVSQLIHKVAGYESVRRASSLKEKLDVIRNFEIVITPNPREFKKRGRKH